MFATYLRVSTSTHSDNLKFVDVYGNESNVDYTMTFKIYPDTNRKYTSHKFQNRSFTKNAYATFHLKSLDLLSLIPLKLFDFNL